MVKIMLQVSVPPYLYYIIWLYGNNNIMFFTFWIDNGFCISCTIDYYWFNNLHFNISISLIFFYLYGTFLVNYARIFLNL